MITPINFCYWLQGYFEIGKTNQLTEEQVLEIKDHLHHVFKDWKTDNPHKDIANSCINPKDAPAMMLGANLYNFSSAESWLNRSLVNFNEPIASC